MGPRAVFSGRRDHCLTVIPENFLCPVLKRCLVTFMSSATLGRFRQSFRFFPSPNSRMRSSSSKSVAGSGSGCGV